jgi:Fe-S cluster assembly protein SufD
MNQGVAMTAMATEKDLFLDHFAQFDNRWASAPCARLRQAARKRFHELSFPGPKTEDWRFTSVAGLLKTDFDPAVSVAELYDTIPGICHEKALRLVFVNGHFADLVSTLHNLPHGVHVGNLLGEVDNQAENRVGKCVEYRDQIFTALNTSLFHDAAFIWIADGVVLERPVEILNLSYQVDKPPAIHPRTLVVLGKNSQATVLERYYGDGQYFNNAVTEISVGDHALLDHYKLQEEGPDAYHLASTQIVLGTKSNFTSHYLSWGAKLVRNEVRVRFDAEHSEATVNGLYVGTGRQHVDNFTVIDHAQPHCASHEHYKGILSGQAEGVFNGKIFVREGAQKTDAKQTNKVLLLSENATIHTKPQLEIFADDVKCTHGATVGQLDEEQLFYLRSRGLSQAQARDLLTYAFVNNILERLKLTSLREHLAKRMIGHEEVS